MLVLDTATLIGWVNAPPEQSPLSQPAQAAISEQIAKHQPLLVSPMVAYKMAELIDHGRLKLTIPLDSWLEEAAKLNPIIFAPVDIKLAQRAATLEEVEKLDIDQRFAAALALKYDCPLISPDPRFETVCNLKTLW